MNLPFTLIVTITLCALGFQAEAAKPICSGVGTCIEQSIGLEALQDSLQLYDSIIWQFQKVRQVRQRILPLVVTVVGASS